MEISIERCNALRPMGSYERFEFYEYFDLENPYSVQKNVSSHISQVRR